MAGKGSRSGAGRYDRAACALAAALLPFAWLACASQGAPSGGPEDKEPPAIVTTAPAPGQVNVEEPVITIEFGEYVDRRSFQESAFLSPYAGALRFEWDGTAVEVAPAETLRTNTTYILTVGTDLKDSRNNRLDQAFTLPFSTGAAIDSCFIAGRVDDPDPTGVMVFAYHIGAGRGDTLDPARTTPDYLTQTGKDGTFLLRNLREGEYRLLALRDAFRNLVYDVGTDRYGMASADFALGGEARGIGGVGVRLTGGDTVRPFLSGARAGDARSVVLRFNEPVILRDGLSGIRIADTASGASLAVSAAAAEDSAGSVMLAITAPQDSTASYRVSVTGVFDTAGNAPDSAGLTAVFAGGSGRDTVAPSLTVNVVRDSVTGFLPLDTLRFEFTAPVDTAAFSAGLRFSGPGGTPVAGRLRWRGGASARFAPREPLEPGGWYALSVRLDSIRGLNGTRGPDSTLTRRFRAAEPRMLASIEGVVAAAGEGPTIVEVTAVSGGGPKRLVSRTGAGGAFAIGPLPEGRYVLSAFLDRNGNGAYDCGVPRPFMPGEPFALYADTVALRPRWPVEGIRIEIGR